MTCGWSIPPRSSAPAPARRSTARIWPGAGHKCLRRSSLTSCSRALTRAASLVLPPEPARRRHRPGAPRTAPTPCRTQLLRRPLHAAVVGAQLNPQGPHQPHGLRLLRRGIPTRGRLARRGVSRHNSILVSKVRSLQATQCAPMQDSWVPRPVHRTGLGTGVRNRPRNAARTSGVSRGRTWATYWSGRTRMRQPASRSIPRWSKMLFPGAGVYAFS